MRDDWKHILKKAWSIRLIVLAFILTAIETGLAIFGNPTWLPAGLFAALSGIVTAGAFVARLYAQKEFK